MNRGKLLEGQVKKYLVSNNLFHIRLPDSRSAGGLASPMPSDFVIFPNIGKPCLVECKETQKHYLPFRNIPPSQLKTMVKFNTIRDGYYYVIIKSKLGYHLVSSIEITENEHFTGNLGLQHRVIFPNIKECMDFLINHELVTE